MLALAAFVEVEPVEPVVVDAAAAVAAIEIAVVIVVVIVVVPFELDSSVLIMHSTIIGNKSAS